jgi:membrane-bound metal-dependent hydrolase YbcI (DUF457 family)
MADIATHALVGTLGAVVAISTGYPVEGLAFLLGSMAPDFDVVFVALGKKTFLRLHQGPTHSLLAIPIIASLIAMTLSLLGILDEFSLLFTWWAAAFGMTLHVAMDFSNTLGVKLLWPMDRRFSLDCVFFIDFIVLVTIIMCLMIAAMKPEWGALALSSWISGYAIYSVIRVHIARRLKSGYGLDTLIPSGARPWIWFYTRTHDHVIECGSVSALTQNIFSITFFKRPDDETMRILGKSQSFMPMSAFLKRLTPVRVERNTEGCITRIIARCIAVPNFANRYGEIEIDVSYDGSIVSEKVRI